MPTQIVTDESVLSIKCSPCNVTDPSLYIKVDELISTAEAAKNPSATGLAFNQIGVLLRGFVIKLNDHYTPIINPQYVSRSTSMKSRNETCLSRPGMPPIGVRRHNKVQIEYYDVESRERVRRTFHAFEARVIQHENDHLNGVLI